MAFAERLRAKTGAMLLDVLHPGWAKRINLRALDLSNCDVCVLGQLFGTYEAGCTELFAVAADAESAPYAAGFNTLGNFSRLTTAWKDEIRKRKEVR